MSIYPEIAGRIRSEIPLLHAVVKKASDAWFYAAQNPEHIDIYFDPDGDTADTMEFIGIRTDRFFRFS